MIDFDALCLAPAMNFFGRPIVVTRLVSAPEALPFGTRGVWSSKPVDVGLLDDRVLSSQIHTLGVRSADFVTPLLQGDQIDIPAYQSLPAVGRCLIDDVDSDGQGGLTITLKVMG